MILTNTLFIKQLLGNIRQLHSTRIKEAYEGPGKTTVTFDVQENTFLIEKCLPVGFQLSDKTLVVGPLAIFTKTLFSWSIANAKDINEETLSLFTILHPKLDILILGLEVMCKNDIQKIKTILHKHDIKNEIVPVQQACGIYNHLVCEGRFVAAGLIPPLLQSNSTWNKQ